MAITRAQQAKQMLRNGGMSLQEAKDMAPKGEFLAYINPKEAKMLKAAGGSGVMTKAGIPSFVEYGRESGFSGARSTGSVQGDVDRGRDRPNMGDVAGPSMPTTNPVFGDPDPEVDVPTRLRKDTGTSFLKNLNAERRANPFLTGAALINPIFGIPTLLRVAKQTGDMRNALGMQSPRPFDAQGFGSGQSDIQAMIDIPTWMRLGFSSEAEYLASLKKEDEKEEEGLRLAFRADGGRIGAQEGGIMPRLNQLGSGVSSAEQMLQEINQRLESAESSLGGGVAMQQPVGSGFAQPAAVTKSGQPFFDQLRQIPIGQPQPGSGFREQQTITSILEGLESGRLIPEGFEGPKGPGIVPGIAGGTRFVPNPAFSQVTPPQTPVAMQTPLSGIPAAGYADGGNVVGGEYDFESARQMYGLGKLVKKVTRTVKKIAKSPIGKAAIVGAGLYGLGGGTFFGKMLPGVTRGGQGFGGFGGLSAIFGNVGDIIGGKSFGDTLAKAAGSKIGLGITAASALAGLLTPEQEEEAERLAAEKGIDIEAARNSILARAQGNVAGDLRATAFLAEGGKPEPVAKKTMPLLDMGGQEMDLRDNGGFVPIGRMEKADDVPARLSKNEFVFTADAVRNAGDGDVDKGAEVMYNMMKNLEAGGEVSKESQGLEGARKMFQTSQRLEEVL